MLILGTAEWDSVIATNQHYVARELSAQYPCAFVEGAGTRRIRMTAADARRVWRRIKRTNPPTNRARPRPLGLTVYAPLLLPGQGKAVRLANSLLLRRATRTWREHPGARILWTFTPYTFGLEGHADASVYHLVDLIQHNPGVNGPRLLAAEAVLARTATLAIGTSAAVAQHIRNQGFAEVLERPNVADTHVFIEAARTARRPESPIVLFTGALSPHKVDFSLLDALAKALPERARLRLIGPVPQGVGAEKPVEELRRHGVEVLDPMPLHELSKHVAQAHVGVVPYAINPLTKGITPLKLYEFLAAGVPVVATALPSINEVADAVSVATSRVDFVDQVLRLLNETSDHNREGRQALAESNSWLGRGKEYRALVATLASSVQSQESSQTRSRRTKTPRWSREGV